MESILNEEPQDNTLNNTSTTHAKEENPQHRMNKFLAHKFNRTEYRDLSLKNDFVPDLNSRNENSGKLFSLYRSSLNGRVDVPNSIGRFKSPDTLFTGNEEREKFIYNDVADIKLVKLSGFGSLKKMYKVKENQGTSGVNLNLVENNKDETENVNNPNVCNSNSLKYFVKSLAGKTEDGKFKTNQDSFFTLNNIFGLENFHVFGVLDGIHGHYISSHVKDFLVSFYTDIENYLYFEKMDKEKSDSIRNNNKKKATKIFFRENFVYEKLSRNDYEFIKISFHLAELDLKNTLHETNFSGTTCNLVIVVDNNIICANIGDSRAILIEEAAVDGFYKCKALSVDHKPEKKEEKERIEKCGGEVLKDETGPYRVWKKGEKYPGIAMSRSIGDFVASSLGVICKPDITEYKKNDKVKAVVLCSDGVWEFLKNERVMQLSIPSIKTGDPEGACKNVIKESNKIWKKEEVIRDDITVISVFL